MSELINVKTAAEILGVTPRTVQRYCEAGTIPALRYQQRGEWRILKGGIQRYHAGLSDICDISDNSAESSPQRP